jgi:hypothetical protein
MTTKRQERTVLGIVLFGVAAVGFLIGTAIERWTRGVPVREKSVITLTDGDDGLGAPCNVGDEIEVQLRAQLGTGQVWEVDSEWHSPKPDGVLRLLPGYPAYRDVAPAAPGAVQVAVFRYEAVGAGRQTLTLSCGRPGQPPSRTYQTTITVSE